MSDIPGTDGLTRHYKSPVLVDAIGEPHEIVAVRQENPYRPTDR